MPYLIFPYIWYSAFLLPGKTHLYYNNQTHFDINTCTCTFLHSHFDLH